MTPTKKQTRSKGTTRATPKKRAAKATAETARRDVHDPELYIQRELSLLEFHRRVLEQGRDPSVPLLERVRFVTISCTNLDELMEVRLAGLREKAAYGVTARGPAGYTPQEAMRAIRAGAHALVDAQYRAMNEELFPALAEAGIRVLRRPVWDEAIQDWVSKLFKRDVLPVLTPVGLDPARPFPRVLNKSLNFIVRLDGTDAFGREADLAVVQVPRALPRLIAVPPEVSGGPHDFVLLSSVVRYRLRTLFPGMDVTEVSAFRLTRNSDLWVDEEEVDDLLHALKGKLTRRHYGAGVRLEVAKDCPKALASFLVEQFDLDPEDVFRVDGPVNLHRLAELHRLVDRPELKYPDYAPGTDARLHIKGGEGGLFGAIRHRDVLLHHPYQSFDPILDLLREAARDPKVLAVKMTLYRTGSSSPVVAALLEAARAGKDVTVVVELRARFDEAANIGLATQLQEAGVTVVYGVVGYKTHAKLMLIVRRETRGIRRYVHLGTGNYHSGTARAYTDFGLLSADAKLGDDVSKLFTELTGLGREMNMKRLLHAPFTLFDGMVERIRREAEHARAGRPARIIAKMNSLSEPKMVAALYEASQAGVAIDLIVRGICCLRPGVPGVSESITVRSIVGRFLEHSRLFHFENGGEPELYCGSADWMNRNLFRRVEAVFPVLDPSLRQRATEEGLLMALEDNAQAWLLQADGTWAREKPKGRAKPNVLQERLLARLASTGERDTARAAEHLASLQS